MLVLPEKDSRTRRSHSVLDMLQAILWVVAFMIMHGVGKYFSDSLNPHPLAVFVEYVGQFGAIVSSIIAMAYIVRWALPIMFGL